MATGAGKARPRTQFFRYGELPLVLLAILATGARHGYELMGELRRLFGPEYRPSAGSVYPAVGALESERLIESEGDEMGRRRYSLTVKGKEALERRWPVVAEIEIRTGARLGPSGDVSEIVERFARRVVALNGHVDPAAVERELERTAARLEELRDG
jgi:DNA-binding PadR family transcriptional regulator